MKITDKEFYSILNELADLVEFAESQEKEGLVDGAYDPHMNVVRSKRILDQYTPDWDKQEYAERA